ncbi:unnamed protein product [Caenorhabditis brenneri]
MYQKHEQDGLFGFSIVEPKHVFVSKQTISPLLEVFRFLADDVGAFNITSGDSEDVDVDGGSSSSILISDYCFWEDNCRCENEEDMKEKLMTNRVDDDGRTDPWHFPETQKCKRTSPLQKKTLKQERIQRLYLPNSLNIFSLFN